MSLVGNLEDLGLGEILQIVSLSRKSGVLAIHSSGRDAKVVFQQGEVVNVDASSYPGNLGEVLLARGILDRATLERAQLLQANGGYRQRLGELLIEQFDVEPTIIEEVVRDQVEQSLFSLFAGREGIFDFELQEDLDTIDDIRTDRQQYLLEKGLNAQFLAMEGARRFDEQHIDPAPPVVAPEPVAHEPDGIVDFEFDLVPEDASGSSPRAEDCRQKRPVVFIDDDEVTTKAVTSLLAEKGYEVTSYVSGEDALTGIDSFYGSGVRPMLVIDLIMPRLDGTGLMGGLEILEMIHRDFHDLPALILTDHHNGKAERRIFEMGYSLMGKPSRTDIVKPAVCSAFGERLMRRLAIMEAGPVPASTETVDIGDELRMEMGESSSPPGAILPSTGISLLRGMLEELNNPSLGGGIILLVLRFAAEFMPRAVIFKVMEDRIVGLGQFGICDTELSADTLVRAIRIPRSEETIFSQVVESQVPVKLHLDENRWCRYLREPLGGTPSEAFLGPIVSGGKVVALLYGDNGDEKRPIGDTDSLEIFLSQAGIAMEKGIPKRRMKGKQPEGM